MLTWCLHSKLLSVVRLRWWTFVKEISVVGVIAQYCLCDMGGRHRPCGGHVSYVMLRAFRCFAFPVCVFRIGCCNAFMLFVCRFGSLWGIRFLYFFFIFRLNSHLQRVCSYLYNWNSILKYKFQSISPPSLRVLIDTPSCIVLLPFLNQWTLSSP